MIFTSIITMIDPANQPVTTLRRLDAVEQIVVAAVEDRLVARVQSLVDLSLGLGQGNGMGNGGLGIGGLGGWGIGNRQVLTGYFVQRGTAVVESWGAVICEDAGGEHEEGGDGHGESLHFGR
ncbi:hypothetical protein VTL71DRAFT_9827 [Oculimacula yallundae]|uniref:Uncharacterized protein n=1 Tax=Oculimacula yallundae TaxID=86028 RepID=A0ABR4BQM7_9HELO